MKFLETYQGGHPFQLDDLKHVQAALAEFVEGVFVRVGSPSGQPCILVGCEITGSIPNRSVSAGWVFFANRVLRVDAATITGSNPYIVIAPASDVLAPSPVVYSNAVPRNCHMDYKGVAGSTPTTGIPTVMYLDGAPRWGDMPWINAALPADFLPGPVAGPVAGPQYRKTIGSHVQLQGAVKGNTASPITSTLFTLPAGYRPARRMRFVVAGSSTSIVDVETNGDVNCNPTPATGQDIYLDGIMFDGQ